MKVLEGLTCKLGRAEYLDVSIHVEQYAAGMRYAIQLMWKNPEFLDMEEPLVTATINAPEVEIPDDEIIVKNYSENEGIVDFLVGAGVIRPDPTGEVRLKFVTAPIFQLTPHFLLKAKQAVIEMSGQHGGRR